MELILWAFLLSWKSNSSQEWLLFSYCSGDQDWSCSCFWSLAVLGFFLWQLPGDNLQRQKQWLSVFLEVWMIMFRPFWSTVGCSPSIRHSYGILKFSWENQYAEVNFLNKCVSQTRFSQDSWWVGPPSSRVFLFSEVQVKPRFAGGHWNGIS